MLKFSRIALMFVLSTVVLGGSAFAAASGKYIGNKKCQMCHTTMVKQKYIFDHWATTKHAKATANLPADKKSDPECLKCHSTGFGQPGGMTVEMAKANDTSMAGNQCEGCHGPGEAHSKIPNTDKQQKKDSMNKSTKETCVKCHADTHPGGEVAGWKKFDYDAFLKQVAHPKAPEPAK